MAMPDHFARTAKKVHFRETERQRVMRAREALVMAIGYLGQAESDLKLSGWRGVAKAMDALKARSYQWRRKIERELNGET